MSIAHGCAKVNLSLSVGRLRDDGLHALSGLFQSVLWTDRMDLSDAESDRLQGGRRGREPLIAMTDDPRHEAVDRAALAAMPWRR